MKTQDELIALEEELREELAEQEQDLSEKYGSPDPEKKESMFKFFKEMLGFKDTWKVGNLKDVEIGQSKLSVRSYLELSLYTKIENMDVVSNYFEDKARMIAATSMGRDGFFPQIAVTNIKKNQSMKNKSKSSSGLFGNKEER